MELEFKQEINLNSGTKTRLLAYDLLEAVNSEGAYANLALPKILQESDLSVQDKAFVTELSYGTIRMQGLYDFIISKFADRPLVEIDSKLLNLLRLGAHQLFSMRVSQHAALNETVEVCNKIGGKSKSAFLNAILRKMSQIEDLDEFLKDKITDPQELLSVKFSHPQWIIDAFFDQLKDWKEVEELLTANNLAATPNLIAWPSLSTTDELLEVGGSKIELVKNGVTAAAPPESYGAIKERRAGVQDAGSQYLTELFFSTNTSENLGWLDLCAAPGGKAKYLYELLEHKNFQANEINPTRFNLLKRLIPERNLSQLDGRKHEEFARTYDRILIDAPCTGLGALRRRPEARWRKNVSDLKELIAIQRDLISSAVQMLNVGGIIGYATCSPHRLETNVQVADALHRNKNLELVAIPSVAPEFKTGIRDDGTMQLWTHRNATDSMFLALFRKVSE
jgi:16S rRNA (cytosine967-C5)-methyltransferase